MKLIKPDYAPGDAKVFSRKVGRPVRFARRTARPARLYLAQLPMKPAGDQYGAKRGMSVDRKYIEEFLDANRQFVRGRCLEVMNANYTKRFSDGEVTKSDVLDIDGDNPSATIVGDLQNLVDVDSNSYDCLIITQVLQYLQSPEKGVKEIHRILAPNGTALVTVPTMAPADADEVDCWRFMPSGVRGLFSQCFGEDEFEVSYFGNLLTGIGYWTGLSQQDLPANAWGVNDPTYPIIVTVRATRH
jgi:SAM-dependent methyltransferase